MTRLLDDWLASYLDFTAASEAPKKMRVWSGISAIAGALRKQVWIDQIYFKWTPNFYIVLVAPPGIVAKSTTAGVAMDLLRQVEGIVFAPDITTWQDLLKGFAEATYAQEIDGALHSISAITAESREFGVLLDAKDQKMVDVLTTLWDGAQTTLRKSTKTQGKDIIENPWLNIIACTTPHWISSNYPEYGIGGGLTSRVVFIYAESKASIVPYPADAISVEQIALKEKLIHDLREISKMCGPMKLTPAAKEWGVNWYKRHTEQLERLSKSRFAGYYARKQTHLHKLAMVLSAATSSSLVIEKEHLEEALILLEKHAEVDMHKVFGGSGRSDAATASATIMAHLEEHGECSREDLANLVHELLPKARDFEEVMAGLSKSGRIIPGDRNDAITYRPKRGRG